MNIKAEIQIVGVVGVPARYGGFETLVDFLLDSEGLRKAGVSVYCEREFTFAGGQYKGANLVSVPFKANGWQSVLFDAYGIILGSFCGRQVLILGTSCTLILPLCRLLFPWVTYTVNMAGLEWSRGKWGGFARRFLKLNEMLAAQFAHNFIADNEGLAEYVRSEYSFEPTMIPYGGDQYEKIVPKDGVLEDLRLPSTFDLAMARAQIDNNIETILEAYASTGDSLVFVSNWEGSYFGRQMLERYGGEQNLYLVGPFYERETVKALQLAARAYVHGHSAGGTNPVLVEAMWARLPVIAFDVSFNRYTTREKALYFKGRDDLCNLVSGVTTEALETLSSDMRATAETNYSWKAIVRSYEDILLS